MSERTSGSLSRVVEHFEKLLNRFGHDPRACDWSGPETQRARFQVLSEALPLTGRSVLDVGCGLADFAPYLRERCPDIRYTGIDLCPSMIAAARRAYPELSLHVANVLDVSFDTKFDLVAASGIFSKIGDEGWPYVCRVIERMYAMAGSAVAFTSLSTWTEQTQTDEFHADPVETLTFCRSLTPWVVLRHDYHSRDFAIYMYKSRNT